MEHSCIRVKQLTVHTFARHREINESKAAGAWWNVKIFEAKRGSRVSQKILFRSRRILEKKFVEKRKTDRLSISIDESPFRISIKISFIGIFLADKLWCNPNRGFIKCLHEILHKTVMIIENSFDQCEVVGYSKSHRVWTRSEQDDPCAIIAYTIFDREWEREREKKGESVNRQTKKKMAITTDRKWSKQR